MKRGFTLVEIIISVGLILLIGTISTFFIIKNKDNNIEQLTNKVLDAANTFINVETDENGNSYKKGIIKGGRGVKLSVKNLIDKGYIDESEVSDLVGDPSNLYILAAISVLSEEECGENIIQYTPSWTYSEEPMYLCGYENEESTPEPEEPTFYDILIQEVPTETTYEKIKDDFVTANYGDCTDINYCYTVLNTKVNSRGLHKIDDYYFYRGNVTNNYVRYGWQNYRIIGFTTNEIRLIYEGNVSNNTLDIESFEATSKNLTASNYATKATERIDQVSDDIDWSDPWNWNVEKNNYKNTLFCLDYSCSKTRESFYGLLSRRDAVLAGIYNYDVNSQYLLVTNESYLLDGKSTILSDGYVVSIESYNDVSNQGKLISAPKYLQRKNTYNIPIRHVIVFNMENIKIGWGNGYKNKPFYITFKEAYPE